MLMVNSADLLACEKSRGLVLDWDLWLSFNWLSKRSNYLLSNCTHTHTCCMWQAACDVVGKHPHTLFVSCMWQVACNRMRVSVSCMRQVAGMHTTHWMNFLLDLLLVAQRKHYVLSLIYYVTSCMQHTEWTFYWTCSWLHKESTMYSHWYIMWQVACNTLRGSGSCMRQVAGMHTTEWKKASPCRSSCQHIRP